MAEEKQEVTDNLSTQKYDMAEQDYNATRVALKLPEYGRFVQQMVDYALTIQDREERQHYAEAIADVMIGLSPKMKDVPDFQHKIWDHLAYLSNYELDIDYPFDVRRFDRQSAKPAKLSYPKRNIRYRHYGHLIEKAMTELEQMEEGKERDNMVRLLANRMKRNLADWKGDGIDDAKVAHDIATYTNGKVNPDFTLAGEELMQVGENNFRTRKNKSLY